MKNPKYQLSDEFKELMKATIYFVEATSCEELNLWEKNHEELKWENSSRLISLIIGLIGKTKKQRVVNVLFKFVTLRGYTVCFYEIVSRFADHQMVEKFIKKNHNVKGERWPLTDAMNFHHVIHDIARRIEKKDEKKKTKKAIQTN